MESLWNNWFLIALLAPMVWALTSLIDVFFISEDVYQNPLEGTVISGLFCCVPILFILLTSSDLRLVPADLAISQSFHYVVPAMLAGVFFFIHIYYYFKALFANNDASSNETLVLLSVLVVPVLAFILLGERLSTKYYLALALALCGILILVRQQFTWSGKRALLFISLCVFAISLTMVLQAMAFKHLSYTQGVFWFSVSGFVLSASIAVASKARRDRIILLFRRHFWLFAIAEVLQLGAMLTSQRATAIGPSVSLVAIAECALPLFVMIFSFFVCWFSRRNAIFSRQARDALSMQFSSAPSKLIAVLFIAAGIGTLQLNGAV